MIANQEAFQSSTFEQLPTEVSHLARQSSLTKQQSSPSEPLEDSSVMGAESHDVVAHILRLRMNDILCLAEGVGEYQEYEANDNSLEEFRKYQEKQLKLFKQQRMPMIGGGGHNSL